MSVQWAARAVALCALAGCASAGITEMQWDTISINALDLGVDGVWSEGDDYDYREYDVTMFETWVGGFGRDVIFDVSFDHDGSRGGTSIGFIKSLNNSTNFFWSSFQIVLTPGLGSTISNVTAAPNAAFGDVSVNAGGGGSWVLLWDQDGGTGVSTGGSTAFTFGFEIAGNLGFMMKQTPLPAPGGVALLGLAGACGLRRRRA